MSNVVSVRPNSPNNSHHLSLSGGGRTFGIKLSEGAKSIIESPLSPSNIETAGGIRKFGDFDPQFASIEMRDWTGGRGNEFLSDDPTKYYDGYGWSLTPGVWHQAPQWRFGEFGTATSSIPVSSREAADNFLPGAKRASTVANTDVGTDMHWFPLITTGAAFVARAFKQQGSTYTMRRMYWWVRRIGSPPTALSAHLHDASITTAGSSRPASSVAIVNDVLDSTSVPELESFLWISGTGTFVTQSTDTSVQFWATIGTSGPGTEANHWEIGYSTVYLAGTGESLTGTTGKSTNGWVPASTLNPYFRVGNSHLIAQKWLFFELDRALYAASWDVIPKVLLYINGDRGKVTTGSPTVSLKDETKNWADNRWSGAYVLFTAGDGEGQIGRIDSNTSNVLNYTIVNTGLTQSGSSNSEYIIYGTDEWTRISTAITSSLGTGFILNDIAVSNKVAHFAFGSTFMRSFQWNSSIHQVTTQASTYFADYLHAFSDPVSGPQIARAVSSDASITRAPAEGFTTALNFSSAVKVGGTDYRFTNLTDYNGQLYAFKEDSIWLVRSDRAEKLNIGLGGFVSTNTGAAAVAQNLFLYFSWSHSLERMQGGTVDDIGPWKGTGLKPENVGPVTSLQPYIAWTLAGIDTKSTGANSVLVWNGRGWHEVLRLPTVFGSTASPTMGQIYMQNNPFTNPRLWVSWDGQLICQSWPKDTLNPLNDASMIYQHAAVLEPATINMDAVQLPKLFSQVSAVTNMAAGSSGRIYCEYQLDNNIGSTKWLPAGAFSISPADSVNIRQGDKRAIRLRIRGVTEQSTSPTKMYALVTKALARTPVRRQWVLRASAGDFQVDAQGLDDSDPDDFYLWLRDMAVTAEPILMRAAWSAMDDLYVFLESPTLQRLYTTPEGEWGGELTMTIREMNV